ncbi:hypothetical protein LEP1GSC103_2782 [Leptospira borgpetersenii serovar Javanica str. UI 09931]|uniref:Uncharacterized protein n=6 Tax=Leptospira borgpetersenii TaxID=174 RepID=M3GEU7_LEPBO|nr:hypothetical protein LBBP_00302 [Leptospira borgpetersenii serovar Ballum]EKP13449.1 hypothetical protein LEP1GSC128_3309 [Leptospira borgpetersenii str. 200801926]EKQ91764.1 hypothetical protein LEP1GSC101_3125 [Leptospira borgpetersenii str. UI 09149]EKQ98758.1 hypothetical protein LEP1GSC121_0566 [Leptospira borgpetersenii serovar Castellonis str. 200801910]EMF99466.1 hypothetical protein LEP1GSC123_4658 [Leptospira borgpetersenii str. 200701203]EMK13230.1 hypothetical protein LEP1GSC066
MNRLLHRRDHNKKQNQFLEETLERVLHTGMIRCETYKYLNSNF